MIAITEPARRGHVRLRDDRQLGVSEWGPEDGTPVLFFPGAGTSSALGPDTEAVEALRVRWIGLDRPGLGRSDAKPGRTLADVAADAEALCAAYRLDRPYAIGFSQGAPFALATAVAGLVRGLALVSFADELAAFVGKLPPELDALVHRAVDDPEGAEAYFAGMTSAVMHGMVVGMSSELDRAIYAEPAFDAAYRRALDEGFAQGAAGYARDTILAFRPWSLDLARIAAPVDLWYGAHDASPVHSPDRGETLASRVPRARRHVVESAGGALLWTHARAVLARLLSA
jgi:pimeloyl-ACP methyl ester carboxylesterase